MGCGASSTASVLEPRHLDAMRDMEPHRDVTPAAQPQQAPLRVMRPAKSETPEEREEIILPDPPSTQTVVSPIAAKATPPAGTGSGPASPSLPTTGSSGAVAETGLPIPFPGQEITGSDEVPSGSTRSPGERPVVQPRRHSAQRRAVALHTHSQWLAEQTATTEREQPVPQPATAMRASEHRGKQPQVMSSSHHGEDFLPRKLPPIRRTWMTSLVDLPPVEKSAPPRQLAAGLARARDEAVQNLAIADVVDSRARARARNYARRSGDVENSEELSDSMAMYTEMRRQNDAALASLSTPSPPAMAAVYNNDVEAAQFSAGIGGPFVRASWSCGTASLDLDLLELSSSSLSLSQELERSSAAA